MDVILAIAFGISLLAFGLVCAARVVFPCEGVSVLLSAKGDGEDLQQKMYALMWLRGLGLLSCGIYLRDCGLTPEGKRLVEYIRTRWTMVELWEEETTM